MQRLFKASNQKLKLIHARNKNWRSPWSLKEIKKLLRRRKRSFAELQGVGVKTNISNEIFIGNTNKLSLPLKSLTELSQFQDVKQRISKLLFYIETLLSLLLETIMVKSNASNKCSRNILDLDLDSSLEVKRFLAFNIACSQLKTLNCVKNFSLFILTFEMEIGQSCWFQWSSLRSC